MLVIVIKIIFMIVSGMVSIGWFVLYYVGIYQKKHIIKVENISCTHDKYSDNVLCSFKITNIAEQPISINKIYIKPSQINKKYVGEIKDSKSITSYPITLSMLDAKKITVIFPVDLSRCENYSTNVKSLSKPWVLVLQTNRLPRRYKISSPF